MYNYSEVDNMVEQWKSQGLTKEELIIKTAEAELGWPYVWGAVGAQCIPSKRTYYAQRTSCPEAEAKEIIAKCQALNGSGKSCGGCTYYPNNMRTLIDDCQGFVKQVCSRFGISFTGGGATSMWDGNSNWIEKGTRDTLPEKLCCIFWQASDKKTMSHIGFYIGNGMMIHCSGTVKKEKISSRVTHWAIPKGLGGNTPIDRPTLRKGSKGEYVTLLQTMLIQRGYSCGAKGADGIFGNDTLNAVKKFQLDNGLQMDGIVGAATWKALDNPVVIDYYTVTIPGLPKYEAEAIVKQYKNSSMKKE